jgi:hypothetical protein
MLSFFPTRGASHTLWNDLKPTERERERKYVEDELVERKTFFFLLSPLCASSTGKASSKRKAENDFAQFSPL